MKVLLTAINAKYIHSNLAVYSLQAYAAENKPQGAAASWPEIEIAEYTINQQTDEILREIYTKKPEVLCLSCYIWNLTYIEELVKELGKICPGMDIWLGGPEVSYDAADVLRRLPEVTGVMKGEGEQTFLELCNFYSKCGFSTGSMDNIGGAGSTGKGEYAEQLLSIQGIVFRDGPHNVVDTGFRPMLDLSTVPFIYQDMKDFEHRIVYYESSRGCPFSCSYCLSSVDKTLRFRKIELVKKELQFFIDAKVPQVKFVDRTFNCKHSHAMAIWNYITEHDNGVTNFHFEVSADLLNEEELALLETMRPGLIQLEIGIQSTNPCTIREIRRTMQFEKVKAAVTTIKAGGNIHQHLDLIAGLPFENIESFARSFDEVYALCPEQLQLGFLKVLKGSYMEEKAEEYGLIYKSRPPYEVLYTKWLPYEEVLTLKGIEEMVEIYYNSRQFTSTMEALEREVGSPYTMYERLADFYRDRGLFGMQHRRSARYEILLAFVGETLPKRKEYYRELLTYDYYLRENAKSRPEFAGAYKISKDELKNFYEKEDRERKYLVRYKEYDKNQIRKMTHLERFDCLEKTVLFDYQRKDPLSHPAEVFLVETGQNQC